MTFSTIQFGKTSGEAEAAELPHLVANGYFDNGLVQPFLDRQKWLVLGAKGSGKSILGEKLKQIGRASKGSIAAEVRHLADFPYKTFAQLMPSSVEATSRFPTSWSWLLCLVLLDALRSHPGSNRPLNIDVNDAIAQLAALGLLPTDSLHKLVIQSSKTTFKAQIPKLLEYLSEKQVQNSPVDLAFINLVTHLKSLICRYSFHGKQFLVVDGLDDILSSSTVQFQTISALVFETARLNAHFKEHGVDVWIVLLCRTDIFESLPGANKNKIRQDSALEIDWYPVSGDVLQSKLFELANLRASLSLGETVDMFEKFLPPHMDHGVPTRKFLTDLTRHTPRDFIAVLTHIQAVAGKEVITRRHIHAGAKAYSEKYFLPEIKDELVGYASDQELRLFLNCVGEIHERRFSLSTLERVADTLGLTKEKLDPLLHAMFGASAIGMTWKDRWSDADRFEFKFRNHNATFNPRMTIVLHKGLWKALNLA